MNNENSNYIEADVIMLPSGLDVTSKPFSRKVVKKIDGQFVYGNPVWDKEKAQHLYFTTSEEIKDGDPFIYNQKVYDRIKSSGLNCTVKIELYDDFQHAEQFGYKDTFVEVYKKDCKKIIASDDPSLNLARPSDAFLKAFCEKNGIWKVRIELFGWKDKPKEIYSTMGESNWGARYVGKIKVAPDNTITIKPVEVKTYTQEEVDRLLDKQAAETTAQLMEKYKDSKTIEEVEKLCVSAYDAGWRYGHADASDISDLAEGLVTKEQWIKQNLK